MDVKDMWAKISAGCALKPISVETFCREELGFSKTTLRTKLSNPSHPDYPELIDKIEKFLQVDLQTVIPANQNYQDMSTEPKAGKPDTDKIQQLQAKIEQLESERNTEKTERDIQARIDAAVKKAIEEFKRDKVVLEFRKPSHAKYINEEIIPEAIEHIERIKVSGDLFVDLLDIMQAGRPIKRPGYIPSSKKLIKNI